MTARSYFAPPIAAALADLSEKDFERQLFSRERKREGVARMTGWRCYHTLRSKGSEPGYPDWTCVRERVLFLECKTEKGVVSAAQREWFRALLAAGAEAYIVRPRNLEQISRVLAARRRPDHGFDLLTSEGSRAAGELRDQTDEELT